MELTVFIYLASIVGNLSALAFIGAIVAVIFIIADIIYRFSSDDKNPGPWFARSNKINLAIAGALLSISLLIPSEKTMYMMAGGYLGQKAIQSETVVKVMKIIEIKLDEYINDLEKTVQK